MQTQKQKQKQNQDYVDSAETESQTTILHFPDGLFGFQTLKNYGLVQMKSDRYKGFWQLHSLEEPGISFLLFPLSSKSKDFISKKDQLYIFSKYEVDEVSGALFAIISLVKNLQGTLDFLLNLQAPILVDTEKNQAWQHIFQNSHYEANYKFE